MDWQIIVPIVLAVIAVGGFLFYRSRKKQATGGGSISDAVKRVWNSDASVNHIAREVRQFTPKGVAVWSRKGLTDEHLKQADEALTELFADVEANFPGQADPYSLDFAHYEIYEPSYDCVPSPVQRVPCFYVKDGSLAYDQSEWDQHPEKGKSVVMAPERVFSMTTVGSTPRQCMMMVCPDLANWRNAIRYGAEHSLAESALENNDLFKLGLANRIHTGGSGHPFIPSRAKGLISARKTDWNEFAPISPIAVK